MKPLPLADLDHVLEHTRPLWDELRGRRIFITGGTGFFGKWLVETFVHANRTFGLDAEAVVLSRATRTSPHREVSFVQGDVRTFDFPTGSFSHVVHAATTSSAPVPDDEMRSTIVDGTRRVLDFAASRGARKLLFTSSGAVYGRQPLDMTHIPETYMGAPDTVYGRGKLMAEHLCTQSDLDVKIARCFAFAGPHLPLDAHFAVGNFIRDALAGGPIKVGGDGTPLRSYLYAADLAIWLWTILFKGESRQPHNVGSEDPISIADLAQAVAVTQDPPLRVEIAAQPPPTSDPRPPASRYVPSCAHAHSLGLRSWVLLNDQIRATIAWYRSESA